MSNGMKRLTPAQSIDHSPDSLPSQVKHLVPRELSSILGDENECKPNRNFSKNRIKTAHLAASSGADEGVTREPYRRWTKGFTAALRKLRGWRDCVCQLRGFAGSLVSVPLSNIRLW